MSPLARLARALVRIADRIDGEPSSSLRAVVPPAETIQCPTCDTWCLSHTALMAHRMRSHGLGGLRVVHGGRS